jgi:hypothetical protein
MAQLRPGRGEVAVGLLLHGICGESGEKFHCGSGVVVVGLEWRRRGWLRRLESEGPRL